MTTLRDPVVEQALALIDSTGMLPAGCRVLAAVSGGQDSCTLLHVLHTLAAERGWSLQAAHLHHGLRGADADGDEATVRSLATALGVALTVERVDVRAIARLQRVSLEEAGRNARADFLSRAAAQTGSDRVALGHTLDDRAETLLLNLMRGTSPDGLGAMAPVAGSRVRPLLLVRRAGTEAYCRRHRLPFRTDAHNLDLSYARNRVRAELLPTMASYCNPSVTDGLARLAGMAAEDAQLLGSMAARALEECVLDGSDDRVTVAALPLANLHPSIRRRAIRLALSRVSGNLVDIGHVHSVELDRLLLLAARGGRGRASLPGNRWAEAAGGRVTVWGSPPSEDVRIDEALAVPGSATLQGIGLTVSAARHQAPDALPALDAPVAWVRFEAVKPPLRVRTRLPGDRLHPLCAPGTRKLQDYLTDRKVPRSERGRVLLVEDGAGILWVVGHTVTERARVSPGDPHALRLSVAPVEDPDDG